MWLQLNNKPTGAANDKRQSLRSVDNFSKRVSAETVAGKSSVSESVCKDNLLLPIRTSSAPKPMSCIGVPVSLKASGIVPIIPVFVCSDDVLFGQTSKVHKTAIVHNTFKLGNCLHKAVYCFLIDFFWDQGTFA